jgi:hypothetical protein
MASAQGDTTGPLLAQDKIERYRPLGAFGRPAYESYVQLRAMLLAKRGAKFANYFAKPSYEAQTRDLRWTAEVAGTARGWHEMAPEEQAQHALELEVVRSGLKSFAQELRAQSSLELGGSQAFASLLEQALKVPAQGDFLYVVGDQPVIAFWGFETQSGGSVEPTAAAPAYAPAARPSAAGLATPVAGATAATAATAAGTAVLVRKRPWWWLLLWILLGVLLLLALLWLLRSCTERAPLGLDVPFADKGVPPDTAKPGETALPDQPGTITTPGDTGTPGVATDGRDGRAVAVPGEGGRAGVDVGGDTKPDVPGDTGPPPADGRGTDVARTNPPPVDPSRDVDKQPTPDGQKGPDALAKTDPPRPLELPPSDNKSTPPGTAFLEGRWKADPLADAKTNQPVDLSFNFDKQGKGEITLRRADGSTCKGAVSGTMSGGKLNIEGSQRIPCSNGDGYAPPKIECTKAAGGKTQCFGVNPNGSKYYMGIARGS